jgi:hypothetical protein
VIITRKLDLFYRRRKRQKSKSKIEVSKSMSFSWREQEKEVGRLEELFYGLSVLGFAFLSIECLWIPCFGWLSSKKRERLKWGKTDGICTF